MKFNPVLAFYGALSIAAAVIGYEVYQKLFGGGGVFDKAGAALDQAAEDYGYQQATNAFEPQLTYLQARSAWFKAHNLTGSAAIDRASQPDFPNQQAWAAGAKFPDA